VSFSVEGKVALVTGANRGIGRTIVETLLKNGARKVYAAVRDVSTIADWVDQSGGSIVPITVDLTKPPTIQDAASKANDVELLVNNAGIATVTSPLAPNAIQALQEEIEVNLYGLIRIAHAFAPILAANGGGAIVQLNSVVSIRSFGNVSTYSASKAASYSITQALRDQLQSQNTLVLSVHPGPIATDMAKHAGMFDMADPPSVVADGIVRALSKGDFHLFPDNMAKKFWLAYEPYARQVVESDPTAS
jgi:NAD(P)-dependent dehydrogenase (short-subunit alcohol dehydrogenase family)